MKKVWVNRFNPDGSSKPMSEWKLKECKQNQLHAYKVASGNYAFNFECLPSRHCLITPHGENEESGVFFEYIGNQRGDGWLYVADGDMPPCDVEVWTFDGCDYDKDYVDIDPVTGAEYFANSGESVICWQPIQKPKYILN